MTVDIGSNLSTVLLALISAIGAIAAAYFAYRGGQKSDTAANTTAATHVLVDGRMTELLDLTRASATAAGVLQGKNAGSGPVVVAPAPPVIDGPISSQPDVIS